ncbi:MAG: histidine kinase [Betaproteobacteria bacterium]|nr:histidine kinase [Betaproteobacteria bacterium]
MPDISASPPGVGERSSQVEIARLNKIIKVLIARAERVMGAQSSDFSRFQATILLEEKVRSRTQALRTALAENETITHDLQRERGEQIILINKLEQAQNQLLQSEKMASLGQLAAGVAHEINNPIGFVNSNLGTLKNYIERLLGVLNAYEACEAETAVHSESLIAAKQAADLDFLREDIVALFSESRDGLERVKKIVQDLKDFSHIDGVEWQWVDLHKGLDSTLNVVNNEIKYKAEVVKEYGELPEIECLPGQLNQVFMNLLVNAAHAIRERGTITIRTGTEGSNVWVEVADTGSGIAPENLPRVFDPFFTTKPAGKGTGLGLSLSYGIVKKHGGRIDVKSELGSGTTFRVTLPVEPGSLKEGG